MLKIVYSNSVKIQINDNLTTATVRLKRWKSFLFSPTLFGCVDGFYRMFSNISYGIVLEKEIIKQRKLESYFITDVN